jgi:acylphosphatase
MMAEKTRVVRVTVRGRVQAVGYRAWTAEVAEELGLAGWVRNRRDGSVEALFAGGPETVSAMIDRCREGPWAARVTEVQVEEDDSPPPVGFDIRPTA